MRNKIDMRQFTVMKPAETLSMTDSLEKKIEKLNARGLTAEEIADRLCLNRDLFTGKTLRDNPHYQKLLREVMEVMRQCNVDAFENKSA